VIRYKLHVALLACLSFPYFTRLVGCRPSKCRISAVFGGPLKHAMETGNFREFHTVAGGNFLTSEREFPVALIIAIQMNTLGRLPEKHVTH